MISRTTTIALAVFLCGLSPLGILAAQSNGAGQRRSRVVDSIPHEYMPPAGMCRIWVDGVPASQQPTPTDCPAAVRNKPANARVIYGVEMKAVKAAPLIPPLPSGLDPRAREAWESKRISDGQLFGDRSAGSSGAFLPGGEMLPAGASTSGPMGSYGAYVVPNGGGTAVGVGPTIDPRYLTGNPNIRPPGYGSSVCLDRDGDGWCDDSRYGPPVCLDKDNDGRCDDLPAFASQAYPQVLPPMAAVLDVLQGRPSVEVMQWLGTNEFTVRVPDQGKGGTPWRAIFLDQAQELLQIWTDTNRDGRADRVEVFRNGQRVKLIQR